MNRRDIYDCNDTCRILRNAYDIESAMVARMSTWRTLRHNKAWDCYCAIIIYRKHINISFPSGASLSDPEVLLHGTGARIRHLKIRELKDVQTPAVRKLLKEARKNAFELVADGGSDHDGVRTVIKTGRKKK